jgi:hypothetical protein
MNVQYGFGLQTPGERPRYLTWSILRGWISELLSQCTSHIGSTITVFILLLKDSIAENRVPSSFLAPAMTEYNDSSYLGYLTELQMEFYIKLLQMLVKPRYAFFNVLGGKMAMLATQVNPIDSSVSVDFLEVVQHNIIPPLRYLP